MFNSIFYKADYGDDVVDDTNATVDPLDEEDDDVDKEDKEKEEKDDDDALPETNW